MNIKEKTQRIQHLRRQIARCTRCGLHATRTNTVPGEGAVGAEVMFIGEAPGKQEDLQGKPFVGRAGGIFDRLLDSVGLDREQIYVCNLLKCRPPGNRDPQPEEIKACIGSLDIQLDVVSPRVIATLGRFAMDYIFQKFNLAPERISQAHGRVFERTGAGCRYIVPLYHPAVATYNPQKIKTLLKDMRQIDKILKGRV